MAKNNSKYPNLVALRDELNALLGEEDTTKKTTAPAADDEDFEDMAYNDLKKLCKSKGLSAAGSRDELIARLTGADEDEDEEDEDEDEAPVKKSTSKKSKKAAPADDDDDDEDDDDDDEDSADDDDEDEEDVQSLVEAATEDMSLEDLAEFCEENGLSSKGKRQALIARIVKAVEAGDIELSDEDDEDEDEEEDEEPAPKKSSKSSKSSKKSAPADDDEDEDEDEPKPTKARAAALKTYDKDTRAQFKKGEIEKDDIIEFLCDFYDKDKKAYKKMSDTDLLDAYIEASSNLIDDDGEIVEEGAYTVNGVPFCCGRPLNYDEDSEQYVCEHCGETYEADED